MPFTRESCRNARDLERIDGDVLAHPAVAAGGGRHENAVLVAEIDGQAVDLQLQQPTDVSSRGSRCLRAPVSQLVRAEDVVEAEHALGVFDGREHRALRRAHRLRRRILSLHLGEGALHCFEPPHPPVVGRVVDDLGVAPVVRVAGAEDEVGQSLRVEAGVVEVRRKGDFIIRHSASVGGAADIALPLARRAWPGARGRTLTGVELNRRWGRPRPCGRP